MPVSPHIATMETAYMSKTYLRKQQVADRYPDDAPQRRAHDQRRPHPRAGFL